MAKPLARLIRGKTRLTSIKKTNHMTLEILQLFTRIIRDDTNNFMPVNSKFRLEVNKLFL